MKEKILQLLKEQNDYVSGQDLCNLLGVSRTAIWKNIKALKDAGYQIDSVNNRGYKLIGEPDSLSEMGIRGYLKTKWIGKTLYCEEKIDSTNTRAKQLGENDAANGTVVVADHQTAGKGRRGHSWESPKGVNCYFTVLLRPDIHADRASMITLLAAMALAKAVKDEWKLDTKIKWPNDIVANGKKICGILTESSTDLEYINYLVVGIGVNCNQETFPAEIQETASSISLELGSKINRCQLLGSFLNCFEYYYECFLKTEDLSGLCEEYNHMLINCNKQVRILEKDEERILTALGIDERGGLIVEDEAGNRETIISGEVSVRGLYGYV